LAQPSRNDYAKQFETMKKELHSSDWMSNIDLEYFPTEEKMKSSLLADLTVSNAERILVVGGNFLFKGINPTIFGDRELHINWKQSFSWLCKTCEQVRESKKKAIVVSDFPRESNPPRVRFVEISGAIYKADGKIGGTLREITAPRGTSLILYKQESAQGSGWRLLRTKEDKTALPDKIDIAIYFVGLRAPSYYESVLKAQGCPPKIPVVCKCFSERGDPDLTYTERKALNVSSSSDAKEILTGASEDLEVFVRLGKASPESFGYSGGVLGR
jgi:hypothetical protein